MSRRRHTRALPAALLWAGLLGMSLQAAPEAHVPRTAKGDAAAPAVKATPSAPRKATGGTMYEVRLTRILERQADLAAEVESGGADAMTDAQLQQRFGEICDAYESIIADNPGQIETHILYGKFLGEYGAREQSFQQFVFAHRIDPYVAVVNQQIGNFYAEDEQPAKALVFFERACKIAPQEPVYAAALGELLHTFNEDLVAAGKFTRAELDQRMLEAFARAAQNAPGDKKYQFRHAEAFADTEKPDWAAALAAWQRLHEREDLSEVETDAVDLQEARCLLELGRLREAGKLLIDPVEPVLEKTRAELNERLTSLSSRSDHPNPPPGGAPSSGSNAPASPGSD